MTVGLRLAMFNASPDALLRIRFCAIGVRTTPLQPKVIGKESGANKGTSMSCTHVLASTVQRETRAQVCTRVCAYGRMRVCAYVYTYHACMCAHVHVYVLSCGTKSRYVS